MVKTASFKRLILRAVLRQVSPMVVRLVSVSDQMPLHEFHDVFRTILGWSGDLESISNRGLCGLLLNFRLLFVLHSRIPANEGLPELVIEHLRPDLQ